MKNPFPKQVKKIGLAAPASSADRNKFEISKACLHECGIETVQADHLFAEGDFMPYLSASDDDRANDLNSLLRNESIDLIQCLRGGYGSPKILDRIDWDTLRNRNLPLIGFSDITAIHLAMLAKGAGIPVAGQMTANLASSMEDPVTFCSFQRALDVAFHGKWAFAESIPLDILKPGECRGKIIAANLTLLAALCGSEFLPDFTGTILIVEDIGEKLRKIDRHLTQLRHAGILGKLSGLIFAQFTDCEDPLLRRKLFLEFTEYVNGPVLSGLAFGHEIPSFSFVCGENAAVKDGFFCF